MAPILTFIEVKLALNQIFEHNNLAVPKVNYLPIAMVRIVYHPNYNISFFGLEKLHPFDSKKYGRAWRALENIFGQRLYNYLIKPSRPLARDELLAVHSLSYLNRLQSSPYLAGALEVPLVRYLPGRLIDRYVLTPMRWATMGSILAAEEALSSGLAINLSGGYHHAKPDAGEGFCIYADIALAIHHVRKNGLVSQTDSIVYIDLDAHQGNGVCHCFLNDDRVKIFDIYNKDIYPAYDRIARQRIDCNLPVSSLCQDKAYLDLLKSNLPSFLSLVENAGKVRLAIYNAGTDVYKGDRLGYLGLSAEGILERDLFVINVLRHRQIPTVMVLSGGYSHQSYKFVAGTIQSVLEQYY